MSKKRIIKRKNNILNSSTRENRIVEIALDGIHNRNNFIKTGILKSILLAKLKKENYGECYLGIYEYPKDWKTSQKNVFMYSDTITIDIDSDDLNKALDDTRTLVEHLKNEYGIDENLIRIHFSGSKGFHVELPSVLFGIKDSKYLPEIHKEIVKRIVPPSIQVDTKIYHRRGLLRIPNTINKKSNLYKIPLQVREMFNLTIDEIKELAKKPRGLILSRIKAKKSDLLFDIYQYSNREVLESKRKVKTKKTSANEKLYEKLPLEKVGESERNSTLTSLTGKLQSNGIESGVIKMLVESVNETRCEPPLERKEVDTILKSVSKYKDSTSNSLEVVKLSDIEEAKPREWLLTGAIPRNYPTIIYGDGGTGKSYTTLFIAIQAARGNQTFCGLKFSERQFKVLYLDFELDSSEFQRRASKICNGLDLDKLPDNIFYSEAKKPLPKLLRELKEFIKENNIDLIVIDSFTVSGVDAMNENKVIKVLNKLKSMDVTTLIIDHQSKSNFGGNSPYGSVFKTNLVRSLFHITSKPEDINTTRITMEHNKSNFGHKIEALSFNLKLEEDKITFVEVKSTNKQTDDNSDFDIIKEAINELNAKKEKVNQKDIIAHLKDSLSKSKVRELLEDGKEKHWNVEIENRGSNIYTLI